MYGLLLGALLFTSWAAFLWRYYLRYRQYSVHQANEKRPQEVEELITVEVKVSTDCLFTYFMHSFTAPW